MPEIDLRGSPYAESFPREEQLVSRELYWLMLIFGGSAELAKRRTSAEAGCVYSWCVRSFEYPEIGRIMLSVAVILRNALDLGGPREPDLPNGVENDVGLLIPNIEDMSTTEPLKVRESFHKIIHAEAINIERSEGPSIYDGHLEPRVHLYGKKGRKEWKATVEIYQWAEVLHHLC